MHVQYDLTTKKVLGYHNLRTDIESIPEDYILVPEPNEQTVRDYWPYLVVNDTDAQNKVLEIPADVATVASDDAFVKYKDVAYEAVEEWKQIKLEEGMSFIFPGNVPDIVQTRSFNDLVAIQGLVTRAALEKDLANHSFMTPFRAESNIVYSLDTLSVFYLGNGVNIFTGNIARYAWEAKDALDVATTEAEVDAILADLNSITRGVLQTP
jgi:hypothetical protein